jgi:hypothetical protein
VSGAKERGAGLKPDNVCKCFFLKHDLGTDLHKDLHDKIDPKRCHHTRIICGCCGDTVGGQVREGATDTVEVVWIPAKSTYFGMFRRLA